VDGERAYAVRPYDRGAGAAAPARPLPPGDSIALCVLSVLVLSASAVPDECMSFSCVCIAIVATRGAARGASPGLSAYEPPAGRARAAAQHDERRAESGTGMETQPAWSILAAIGAAAASGGGARAALDDAVQR